MNDMMKDLGKVILTIAAALLFAIGMVTLIMRIDKERKEGELKIHNEYIDTIEYCELKSKTTKDKTECITMIMKPGR